MCSLKVAPLGDKPIIVGHGEYVVYHRTESGEKIAPTLETFEKVYPLLVKFNRPDIADRYKTLRGKIQAVDPSLDITFLPRTYVDLHLVKKCLKEDLVQNDFCSNECVGAHDPKKKDCWHIAFSSDRGNPEGEPVRTLAYKLNASLVNKLSKYLPKDVVFTPQSMAQLSSRQIKFFTQFHDQFDYAGLTKQGKFSSESKAAQPVLFKFCNPRFIKPGTKKWSMAITDKNAHIIKDAVTLECSPLAENNHLIYRGSNFVWDSIYDRSSPDSPYSFSYGTSLFAGAIFDGAGTSFYWGNQLQDFYALAIPPRVLGSSASPFVIPSSTAVTQVSASGEVFHARGKVWKTDGHIRGFDGDCPDKSPFISTENRERLTAEFTRYKKDHSVFLKITTLKLQPLTLPPAFRPEVRAEACLPVGQTLYIRGEGAGLSWSKGKAMTQVGEGEWSFRFSESFKNVPFKVLVNDLHWEDGANHEIGYEQGVSDKSVAITPRFSPSAVEASLPAASKGTRLSVRYNTGVGKSLSLRGEGAPGLSWEKGIPLKNIDGDLWIWESSADFSEILYKILLDDKAWEKGPDRRAACHLREEITPEF